MFALNRLHNKGCLVLMESEASFGCHVLLHRIQALTGSEFRFTLPF
jgi:hypothetical protein